MEEQQGDRMDMAKGLVQMAKPADSRIYECKTCKKSFKSSQALGGHRASHNRKRAKKQQSSASGMPRVYSCSKCGCGCGFWSGQALGGHMRIHVPFLANNKPSFDLNLPLVEEGDDLNEDGSY